MGLCNFDKMGAVFITCTSSEKKPFFFETIREVFNKHVLLKRWYARTNTQSFIDKTLKSEMMKRSGLLNRF